jgi:hypothetical protein
VRGGSASAGPSDQASACRIGQQDGWRYQRTDLLTVIANLPKTEAETAGLFGGLCGMVQSMVGGHHATSSAAPPPNAAAAPAAGVSADSYCDLVTASQQEKIGETAEAKRIMGLEHQKQVAAVMGRKAHPRANVW